MFPGNLHAHQTLPGGNLACQHPPISLVKKNKKSLITAVIIIIIILTAWRNITADNIIHTVSEKKGKRRKLCPECGSERKKKGRGWLQMRACFKKILHEITWKRFWIFQNYICRGWFVGNVMLVKNCVWKNFMVVFNFIRNQILKRISTIFKDKDNSE